MNIRLLSLALLILLSTIFNSILQHLFNRFISTEEIKTILEDYSPENLFSLGKKIKLSKIGTEEAELIPSLSYESRNILIKDKNILAAKARTLPANEKSKIFENIKGVGKKKAQILEQYIELK